MAKTRGKEALWEKFLAWGTWVQAARRARRCRRDRPSVQAFEADREENLATLRAEISSGRYRPGRYHRFNVRDPKQRQLAAPAYRDRVVQQALVAVLSPIWERNFVYHNFACREGKGLHRAAEYVQRMARRYPWYLKLDVKMKRRVHQWGCGELEVDRLRSSMASWAGHWQHASSYYLRKATICRLRFALQSS